MQREPDLSLHPAVMAAALDQLRDGASLTEVQAKNRSMYKQKLYTNPPGVVSGANYRWILKSSDTRTLYRQHHRLSGIDVKQKPHINVHAWLDPDSSQFNPILHDAIFHYAARIEQGDRFEVCIATDEMRKAAWKYGHDSQLILDGTFGVCDAKILLFIVMGIDEKKRGVPLAFLLFSAPSGNRHTSAGYDTSIIEGLLRHWAHALGKTAGGKYFVPKVFITDTDLMERGALLRVFPGVWLLICRFHLRQSWRNHRQRYVKGKSPTHVDVRERLKSLEDSIITASDVISARQNIAAEETILWTLCTDLGVLNQALEHIRYLLNYWTTDAFWPSWSDFGRRVAAQVMKCSVEGVLPTTNHLESFNGLLKRKHLKRFQRNGRRLRVDVLVKMLVTTVLPSIFEQRALELAEEKRWDRWLAKQSGGVALLVQRTQADTQKVTTVAWLQPNADRDERAAKILADRQIMSPVRTDTALTFECYSSLATEADPNPFIYNIELNDNRTASCTCADFRKHGGACKHLRAALLRIEELRQQGVKMPNFNLPKTQSEAYALNMVLHSPTALTAYSEADWDARRATPTQKAAAVVKDMLIEGGGVSLGGDDGEDEFAAEMERETYGMTGSDDLDDSGGEGDEFDFTAIQGSGERGYSEQAMGRACFELDQAAPKLGDLAAYLQDAHFRSQADVDCLSRASVQVDKLAKELHRLILDASIPPNNRSPLVITPSPLNLSNHDTLGGRCVLKTPLAPSPERGSTKRKQSHGPH